MPKKSVEWSAEIGRRETPEGRTAVGVKYAFQGNEQPYLSIVGYHWCRDKWGWVRVGEPDECGQIPERIARAFPELAPYLRWVGAGPGGPMHYRENAIYFAEYVFGVSRWDPRGVNADEYRRTFERHVVMGAVQGDEFPAVVTCNDDGDLSRDDLCEEVRKVVGTWCDVRHDALVRAFKRDMVKLRKIATDLVGTVEAENAAHEASERKSRSKPRSKMTDA